MVGGGRGLRRGGLDRIVVPEPWTRPIDALVADGVRGEPYAHEVVTVPPGTSPRLLAAVQAEGVAAWAAVGAECVGAFRVAMGADTEAILLWALPDWAAWGRAEQAWLAASAGRGRSPAGVPRCCRWEPPGNGPS